MQRPDQFVQGRDRGDQEYALNRKLDSVYPYFFSFFLHHNSSTNSKLTNHRLTLHVEGEERYGKHPIKIPNTILDWQCYLAEKKKAKEKRAKKGIFNGRELFDCFQTSMNVTLSCTAAMAMHTVWTTPVQSSVHALLASRVMEHFAKVRHHRHKLAVALETKTTRSFFFGGGGGGSKLVFVPRRTAGYATEVPFNWVASINVHALRLAPSMIRCTCDGITYQKQV